MHSPWNTAWPALTAGDQSGNQLTTSIEDPMHLQNSDHPGMILVSHPLTGTNYLSWKKSMMIALGAKSKLGFVDGKIIQPEEDSPKYGTWKRTDCMIISWILNTLSKEIVDAFIYADNAKEL